MQNVLVSILQIPSSIDIDIDLGQLAPALPPTLPSPRGTEDWGEVVQTSSLLETPVSKEQKIDFCVTRPGCKSKINPFPEKIKQ